MVGTSGVQTLDIAISDSIVASGHRDGAVRFWSIKDHTLIKEAKDVHDDIITSIKYFPDGN